MGLSLFRAFLVINVFSIGTENPITPKPYRFSVYPVNKCPGSKTEFQRASQRKNCTKDLRYLCTPNKYLSSLIEFCTDRKRSLYGEGNCVVLEGTGDLDHYRCVEKFNRSCPSTPYYDEEIYKYPACLEIDKELRCFIAENGCNQREFLTTETHLNISKMETFGNETFRGDSHGLLAIGYIIAIAVVLTVIILIWIIFQKRKKEQVEKSKDNYENESLLKDNPEIDDDKLRQFLSKGEITVCHVRCIIVGCAKAGKTTLLKRLQNVSYDELMQIERTEMVDFHVNSFEVLLEEETIQSIEKADTVPTILFSKENLERPLKENDGKMAEEAHQPSIEKADTVPTFLFSKENLEMPLKEKDGIMAVEAHQPSIRKKIVSEKSSLKNATQIQIPMDILNNQANNHNAEDEENLICKPHSQDTTLVQNQIFPEPNEQHGEDIDAIVDQNDFEQSAISKIKDAVNELLNEKDLHPRITFLDFAGQSMYYAFHQIFLRPKSCSILVVDLTKVLGDKVGVQHENEKECSQFASWSYRDYYKFWLRSIDVFSDTESPVIIVGTHADGLTEEGRREFPESLLKFFDECCHSDHKRHINADRMYAIGFPDSGSELEDLKKIKKCIANIVKSPRYSKENIRPVWALFEHILNIMKENRKVISRKTLSDYIDQLIAQEFRIDDSEISKMLDFFHRVGVLLYFDKDGLKENIILDIQWLLDAFKCIIDYPVNPEKPDIKRRLFYQTGELDNVELDRIWNVEGKDFLKHKTTIIAYMQQLGLLMPLKELHPIDSNVYYCPSMNSKRFDKTGEHNSKSSILCFKFDEEMQLQINVFYGIVLKCSKLNNWSISTYRQGNKNNICLYQNTACFSFREHNVVLCNCNFEIRVQVWALPEIYDGRLLKKIKHSVEDIIHDVGLSYEIGYKCRKDVLNDEKDVSFISQSIFPVSNYVKCETCEIDKNHVVKNDICWELEVNDENQVAESTVPVKENVEDATAKGDGSSVILDKNTEEVMEQKPTKKNDEDVEDKDQDDSVAVTKIAEEETVENSSLCLEMEDDATSASPLQEMQSKLDGSEVSKAIGYITMATPDKTFIVAAIDFGTTFSGYAYSLISDHKKDPLKIYSPTWENDGNETQKTPTSILFDDKGEFHSFGYEAEKKYSDLAAADGLDEDEAIDSDEDYRNWFYFRRFKMALFRAASQGGRPKGKKIKDDMQITAANGKKMSALKVFSEAIRYLKEQLDKELEECLVEDHEGKSTQQESWADYVRWVLTVPAIWSNEAKQFMRMAAVQAGIANNQLKLALEPEAAAILCKHVALSKDKEESEVKSFQPGRKFMVVDCGGGTVDVTAHEVVGGGGLKELHHATGDALGGTNVDRKFFSAMTEWLGEDVMKRFEKESTSDWLEFERNFESKKRSIGRSDEEYITFSDLGELCRIYKELKGSSVKSRMTECKLEGKVSIVKENKFRFKTGFLQDLVYRETICDLVSHLEKLFLNMAVSEIRIILLVGGFSECPMLYDKIKDTFPQKVIINPAEANLAVLKGAVIFGHEPATITERRSPKYYGIAINVPFKTGVHPESYKLKVDGMDVCTDVFKCMIEKNAPLTRIQKTFTLSSAYSTSGNIEIYESDKLKTFTTECRMLGTVVLDVKDYKFQDKKREIDVSLEFGSTELYVFATDKSTDRTVTGKFDCLNK